MTDLGALIAEFLSDAESSGRWRRSDAMVCA